jgi:hypothetical protein
MDPRIADYIRANRTRYTREAIIQQLIAAGHSKEEVEASWDELSQKEPISRPAGTNMATYVWVIFWLGAAAIVVFMVAGLLSGGGLGGFGVGWLIAYLGIGVWPALWFARSQPGSAAGVVAVVLAVPIVMVLIGGGICLGTIVVVMQSMGY